MRASPAIAAAALLAAACAPTYPITPTAPPPAQTPAAVAPMPAPPPALRSPIPGPQTSAKDPCGASRMQGLIGRPRTEVPVPVDPGRQRVACTTCPITEDFDPGRLNFFFEAETGLIKQVRCG